MSKTKDAERKESLERFRKHYPGLWELIVELFGEWSPEPSEPE